MSIFGRIVTGSTVEAWCWQTLRTWTSTYLAEVERQSGLDAGTLQRPRGFVTTPSFNKWPEDQLPALLLVSVGLAEPPIRHGDAFSARWDMGLACICSARTQAESRRNAMLYTAALRALFMQRQSLGGNANGITWQDESYEEVEYDDARSLAAGIAHFTVGADDIASVNAGPLTPDVPLDPDTDPWDDWPIVLTADVDVMRVDEIERSPART